MTLLGQVVHLDRSQSSWLRRRHTFFSSTSLCTYKVAPKYLRDGVLPSSGTICGGETDVMFGNKTATTKRALGHGDLEEQMLEAGEVSCRLGSLTRLDHQCSAGTTSKAQVRFRDSRDFRHGVLWLWTCQLKSGLLEFP